jgi:hypothetical protein
VCGAWTTRKVHCVWYTKVYCIGKQIMGSYCAVLLTFATGYNLLNLWRAAGTTGPAMTCNYCLDSHSIHQRF